MKPQQLMSFPKTGIAWKAKSFKDRTLEGSDFKGWTKEEWLSRRPETEQEQTREEKKKSGKNSFRKFPLGKNERLRITKEMVHSTSEQKMDLCKTLCKEEAALGELVTAG